MGSLASMSEQHSSNGAGAAESSSAKGGELRLGGMALRNGLLIHGPTSWGIAARTPAGGIEIASGPKPNFGGNRVAKVPLVRGPLRLAEAFAVIPIARLAARSSRLPFEDRRVLAAAAGTTVLSNAIRGDADDTGVGREALMAVLGLAPALVALGGSELACYHAAEHKAIGGYEQGADPAEMPKEHQRCGSNLILPMLLLSLAGQLIVERISEKPGRIERSISGLAGLSLAVEAFAYAERNPDSMLGRMVHASGNWIQRIFATREPTTEQLEVGIAALGAVLEAEAR